MIELLLDSSNIDLSVGIAKDNELIDYVSYEAWQCQSEYMIQEIDKLFKKHNISRSDLGSVIVNVGPGSYTGIRIALTIAKILGFCLDIPVCVLSSLQTIAGAKGKRIALIDARSKRAYIGIYKDGKEVIKDQVLPIEDIQELIKKYPDYELVGDTFLLGIENKEIDYVDNMFELSKIVEDYPNIDALVPVYLKEAL